MKKIWMIIAVISIISCKNDVKKDYAVISGKITNQGINEFSLNGKDGFKKTIKISYDGSFLDTLKVAEGNYLFYDGENRIPLYIKNGANLIVNYNSSDFQKTYKISGFGSEISQYLFNKGSKESEIKGEGTKVYTLDEGEYKTVFQKIKEETTEMISSANGISEDFKAKEKKNIQFAYLNAINRYQRYHAHYSKLPDFEVSEHFLDELQNVNYTDEASFNFSNEYRKLVTNFYEDNASKLAEKDTLGEFIAFLKVTSEIPSEIIKNKLLFNNAKYAITYTENLEEYYKTFMEASTNKKQKEEITKSYNKLKTVAKGEPSPKFNNYENFAGGTTSLDDLKGKYVYIDVWATWCGPCKAEIPSLKRIEEKYHNKNISFVSISVDRKKDHDKWLKMVKDKDLKGFQLFADKDWNSNFVKEYLILGIPRFILIDPKGNIVNSNAPRPSDKTKLEDLFKNLKI